ncbi:helix-turn-helix domain-containing protein [Vibrio scophthalmi]|uniref:Ner family transcriptional regulator n=1 Tax=Vibrio scophthalmi LMG 19158 TaxID=870967 RepID=F9RKE8_9VIBR|nr:helix-turn-helix transcriptional regulator [Vibrio scophthalmi]EGU39859.1 Ner family transcriptional regulator [Vibrio scophthalmi LMG 19158]
MKANGININDWHKADVKAELEKKGLTLKKLAVSNDLADGTLSNVFRVNYPKAQKIIADAIGVTPETIWPSRY